MDLKHFVQSIVAGSAVLLFISGCNGERTCERPNCALQNDASDPYPSSAPAEQAVPASPSAPQNTNPRPGSSTVQLQGPRSQADVDALFRPLELVPPVVRAPVASAPAPAFNDSGVTGEASWDVPIAREWNHIVIHHSASATGCASVFDREHRERGWDGLGYHFVIGNGTGSGDGEVEVGYRWTKQMQGAHAGNAEYNQHGIGICLVGDFQTGGRPSPQQLASLRRLVRFLQVKTGVPTAEVCGHGNVPGKKTLCPGQFMDLDGFRASLGGGAIGVPIHIVHQSSSKPSPVARASSYSGAAMP